jgi:enamine deaminase RidA (YjgF/YER057c/UK114 family)
MNVTRIEPGPRMSRAVIHGDTVYLSGIVASNPEASVADQTLQILAEIERLLSAAGSSKSKILSATIWLADMATFADMNGVWDGWVEPGNTPCRATVEARLAVPTYKVEIMMVAAR